MPGISKLWFKATSLELLCLASSVRDCCVFGSVMFATRLRITISVVLEGLWKECAAFREWRPSVVENLRMRFVYQSIAQKSVSSCDCLQQSLLVRSQSFRISNIPVEEVRKFLACIRRKTEKGWLSGGGNYACMAQVLKALFSVPSYS